MPPKNFHKSIYTRREILKKLGLGTAGLLLWDTVSGAESLKQFLATPEGTKIRLAPVTISRKRIRCTVVNCTGLGAADLIGDAEMFPIKGQSTILQPQPEVDYITLPPDLYMFPRRDEIVLGGTFERHVATMEPDLAAEERILDGHARFFAAISPTAKPPP